MPADPPSSAPLVGRRVLPLALAALAALLLLAGSAYVVRAAATPATDTESVGSQLAWPAVVLLTALLGSVAVLSAGRWSALGWWWAVCLAGVVAAIILSPYLGDVLTGSVVSAGGLVAGDLLILCGGWWLIVRRGPLPW